MSLIKAIQAGKEHRLPYRKAKAVSYHCRNHGGCEWCEGNRLYSSRRREEAAQYDIKNYEYIYL